MSAEAGGGFLALRDRAHAYLTIHGPLPEAELLAHVYSGAAPSALQARLIAPLLGDPRLERVAEGGQWRVRSTHVSALPSEPHEQALTALALATTGSNPARGRVVQVAALHVAGGQIVERFNVTVHPGKRVPRYVAERIGLATEVLDDLPAFEAILDDLERFLAERPVVAQDAALMWAFLDAEARRLGRTLAEPALVDANELFGRALNLKTKPSLALVAAQLLVGSMRIGRPEEEARVLGLVIDRVLDRPNGAAALEAAVREARPARRAALRRTETPHALPDEPGVYVLRDSAQTPLYVGKARRLRSRVAAYVHRPLGATRRLEGLVGAVDVVDPTQCATDLEALVLEDREIRRLMPRFNTVRLQRAPRLWIRLPPIPSVRPGKRQLAARRLESSLGPDAAEGDFVGPFRTEAAADQARLLARAAFALDDLRQGPNDVYEARLQLAWRLLHGDTEAAQEHARGRSVALLRAVLSFDVQAQLLPADPRSARYAVLRPNGTAWEGFVIDRAIFVGYALLEDEDMDTAEFATSLLAPAPPRTTPEDASVVLRWVSAQRPPACLVHLPDEPVAAADLISDALASALASRFAES